uniref:Uncharacterized protein n=1 Tax=Rhizophora mucronata TaxID=61149 RepID=A0A2P2P166_RHIMU
MHILKNMVRLILQFILLLMLHLRHKQKPCECNIVSQSLRCKVLFLVLYE